MKAIKLNHPAGLLALLSFFTLCANCGTSNPENLNSDLQFSLDRGSQGRHDTGIRTTDGVSSDADGNNHNYLSPYLIEYSQAEADLTFDFEEPPRNDPNKFDETKPPHQFVDWYNLSAYPAIDAPWGPQAAQYPVVNPPSKVIDSKTWQRERILRVAQKYLGTPYQHHHLPHWDPSTNPAWPWLNVSAGHNGRGIDCSNFSALVYNFGLGIILETNIVSQAQQKTVPLSGGKSTINVQTIAKPATYEDLSKVLLPGDLLYLRQTELVSSPITHVALWVGTNSSSPSTPLIIDSHDDQPAVQDPKGLTIPDGVQLRPLKKTGWYYKAIDHIQRIIF